MTGTEVAQRALSYMGTYKYVYGAKGEYCSAAHIEDLIAQSPSYFNTLAKMEAARSKAGNYCADCSGYVCICAEYTQLGSWGLYDNAQERRPLGLINGHQVAGGRNIPVGAVLWKSGHVGIYVGNQMVVEARSEELDVQKNVVTQRDFTYCLLLPGIQYDETDEDLEVEWPPLEVGNNYIPWVGKIVNTPVVVPQISPTNRNAAVGFGLLNNGTLVNVVGFLNEYYKIKSGAGFYGYVNSYFIGNQNAMNYENRYIQWTGVVHGANNTVNVRIGPGTSYDQHASVPSISSGSTVEVLGEVLGNADNRLWYKVRVLGVYEGYIRGDLVTKKQSLNYSPWRGVAKSTTGTVNIRQAPTVNSGLSTLHAPLTNGEAIVVINEMNGDGTIWYEVSDNGRPVGYCRSDLIRPDYERYFTEWDGFVQAVTGSVNIRFSPDPNGDKIPGSPFANGTDVRIRGSASGADGYDWYKVNIGSFVGYCRCDLVFVPSDYPEWWGSANTTTGTLNIRKGPGTNYDLIYGCPSVPNGTQMKVRSEICGSDGRIWYKVIVKGIYMGYVRGDLVDPVSTPAYSQWIGCARSTTGVVNVRKNPTTSDGTIAGYPQLRNGECFLVVGQVDGTDGYLWFYVCILGQYYGYIRSDLVSHGVPIASEDSYASWIGIAKSSNGIVNLRQAPTTGSAILASLTNGTTVEVIGTVNGNDGYVWYQVKCGQNGYIRSDLVLHQGDVDEGNTFIILTCPPRGVILSLTRGKLYPSYNSEDSSKPSKHVGTYVEVSARVRTNSGEDWYRLSGGEYVPAESIRIFESEEYCGGDDYLDTSHHNMLKRPYDMYECSKCGYHVPSRTYLEGDEHRFLDKVLDLLRVPHTPEFNINAAVPGVRFPIFTSSTVDIYGLLSIEVDFNKDAEYSVTFELGEAITPGFKAEWENLTVELQGLGLTNYIPDVESVAAEIGNGAFHFNLSVSPEAVTLEFTIEKEMEDGVTYVAVTEFVFKQSSDWGEDGQTSFGDVVAAGERVKYIGVGVTILGFIVLAGFVGIAIGTGNVAALAPLIGII